MNNPRKLGTMLPSLVQNTSPVKNSLDGQGTLPDGMNPTLMTSASHTQNTGLAQRDRRSSAPLTAGTAPGAHGSGQKHGALALVADARPETVPLLLKRTQAALPDGPQQSLNAELGHLFPKDRPPQTGVVRRTDIAVPAVEDMPAVEAAIQVYREALAPADDRGVAVEIERLMLHYPVKDMTDGMNASLALDWLEDVAIYPLWAIQMACKEWRRTQKWRPTISEFRTLCENQTWLHRYHLGRLFDMQEAARRKANADEKARAQVEQMKADGTWETCKARLFGRIRQAV